LVEGLFAGARIEPMAGDASTRRFYRLRSGDTTRVIMDYGARFTGDTDDMALTRIFEDAALPVSRIERACPEAGCLVLEDLGDRTLESAVEDDSGERRALYDRAVELAAAIAERGTPVLARSERASGPALDAERFRFEMDFFVEHYVEGFLGRSEAISLLVDPLHDLADRAAQTPRSVLCHRDYHSRNLLVRPDGSIAMVDIQDARWGPDTYDLASLLRDAYVDLDENDVETWIESYRTRLADPPERHAFRDRFDVVAAQRMIKALGTFGYQIGSLGRTRYSVAVTRTVGRLADLLPRCEQTALLGKVFRETGLLEIPPAA
ncbi:MAG: phosphotransferase, partial [Acidobacteriota bacterium]|nr:phosphotransferase [Acidobacteriota bacterium]